MMTLIADIALAVTVVLGLGSIAAVVLRRGSPALRHAAWRATLAGVWLAPVAVIAAGMLPVQRPEIAVPVPRYDQVLESGRPRPDAVAPASPTPQATPTPESGRPRPDVVPPREPLPIAAILLSLWGAGALVAFFTFARDARALGVLLSEGAPSDRPATVEAIAQRLGLARLPRVRRSAEVSVPAVAGWLRPTLVLPSEAGADEAALIHELAHVQRGDVPTLAAARLTAAVWWWHPLAWLMLRGLAATAEEACDDVVLALTGARREYAQMLTDWAERTSVAGAVNCGSHGKGLVARVRRVLDERVRPATRLSGAARVAVIAGAMVAVVAAGAFGLRAATPDADGITTVLLMGVDARPEKDDRGRADAIMVLFVNRETDRAALLSLPRNLRVTIPHVSQHKLNAAYPMGGPELVRETVEGVLGVAIDHHVQLDMAQFPEVIDALGGVMIDVPDVEGGGRGMNYEDESGDLHIRLTPGVQHLDGEQALGFVTYRRGDSDFARQRRQQQLLRALVEQKLRGRPSVELVEVVPSVAEAVETDLRWRELADLARVLREVPREGLLTTDMTEYLRDRMIGGFHYVDARDADIAVVLAEVEAAVREASADVTQAVITGLVLGPDGEPVAGAHVGMLSPDRASLEWLTVTTNEDGSFKLEFEANERRSQEAVNATAEGFGLAKVHAAPGEHVEITLPREGAPIRGAVVGEAGVPIAGARVSAQIVASGPELEDIIGVFDWEYAPRVATADDGRFILTGLPPDVRAALSVSADGYARYYRGAHKEWPETGSDVTITLAPEAAIRGRLTRDGEPVAGVRIVAQPQDRETGNGGSATTDEDGFYEIDSLSAGVYNVMVDAPPEWTAVAQEGVEVAVGEHRRDCDLRAIDGVVVRGTLTWEDTGEPVVEAGVGAYGPARPRSSAWVQTAWTDRSGRYEMRLPPGESMLYIYGMPEGGEEATPKRHFVEVAEGEEPVADFRISGGG
ncbi:MAG: LCP family protein [Armatimonadota bacterium]